MDDLATKILDLVDHDGTTREAASALRDAGGRLYVVGGAPRDVLLGKTPVDLDLMVTGLDEGRVLGVLRGLRGRTSLKGADFKVFRYAFGRGKLVEISLPRLERSTGDGHRDFSVRSDSTVSVEDDLRRRDFTVNAIAVSLDGDVVDPHGGRLDVERRVLRVLSERSFDDDPLRIMRGLVAHARHGLAPDGATRAWMSKHSHRMTSLPGERLHDELDKIMSSNDPGAAIRLAHEIGVLDYVLPEIESAFGYDQNNPHHELELGDHLVLTLDRLCGVSGDKDLRLAALLHDVGKPGSAWKDPETGSNHYYYEKRLDVGRDHAELGSEMTNARMTELRYATDRINRVTAIVRHHMYAQFSTMAGAKRFLSRVEPHADDLFLLRWADQGSKLTSYDVSRDRELVRRVRESGMAFDRAHLAVDGRDVIAAGIEPGPEVGRTLEMLVDAVIEDASRNNREDLLALIVGS